MKAIKRMWSPYKPKYENNVPISEVAKHYANQIKQSGIKTLTFHPIKKSMGALSNQFRLLVLKQIIHVHYFGDNQKETLHYLMKGAIEQGYTINEYQEI